MRMKKLLATLMAVMLVLTLIPAAAFADGETAIAADTASLSAGSYYVPEGGITASSTITIEEGNVILDLRGQTITASKDLFKLSGTASLTIQDSVGGGKITDSGTGRIVYLADSSSFELKSGTLEKTGNNSAVTAYGEGAEVKISGGTITLETSGGYSAVTIGSMNGTAGNNPGHFVMTDGTIKSNAFGVSVVYGSVDISGGTIEAGIVALAYNGGPESGYESSITGGKIETTAEQYGIALQLLYGELTLGGDAEIQGGDWTVANKSGVLTVTGDVTITPNTDGTAISNETDANTTEVGRLSIESGTVNGHVGTWFGAETEISGGTISGSVDAGEGTSKVEVTGGTIEGDLWADASSVITVTAGTVNGELSTETGDEGEDDGKIIISGGTFKEEVNGYVVEGMMQDEDGKIVVSDDAVASVNGTGYMSLQAAIDAAGSGDTVTLLQDTTENVTITKDQNITLDLNGCILDGGTVVNTAALNNEGTVVIQDNSESQTGAIKRSDTTKQGCYYTILNNGTMTIEGGSIYNHAGGDNAEPWSGASLICNGPTQAATLNITGGTISQDYFIAVKNDDYGTLNISGGTIESKTQAVQNWTTADISGGTFTGAITTWAYGAHAGKTTISGGTITGNVQSINYQNASVIATVEITSGTINGSLGKYTHNGLIADKADSSAETSAILVSGGSFSEIVNNNFCAEDFVPVTTQDANGKYTVTKEDTSGTTVTGLTLSPSTLTLTAGDTAALTAEATTTSTDGTTGTAAVTWTSSNSSVAAVSSSGKVTALKAGTATITASAGNLQMTCKVTVKAAPVTPSKPSTSSRDDDDDGYAVSVPGSSSIKNGSITVSPRSAEKGDTVTITVKPDPGYELDELTVTAGGAAVKLTQKSDTKYTFTMPASRVSVAVSFVKTGAADTRVFADVPGGHWAEDEIAWAAENGYMNGNTATTFNPDGTVTRQQLWMILARLSGLRPADFAEAKDWAVQSGVTDGTVPGGAVTRQQLVTILYRWAKLMGRDVSGSADLTAYPDYASVASYAVDAMGWSVANGIVTGTAQGTLNPAGTATRAQFAVILYRFCEKTAG